MALDQGYATRILWRLIGKNDAAGAPLTVADGDNNVFLFPGTDAMSTETGPVARTVAAVLDQCFTKPEEQRVAGASGTLFQGCPIVAPEFLSEFVFGYTSELGENGETNLAISSPETGTDCFVCDPSDEANHSWWVMEGVCIVDCENKVIGRKLNVIRAISTAVLSRQLRHGGGDHTALGSDINITLEANDGFGTGPGGVVISNDPVTGLPASNPQVTVNLPAALDLSTLEESSCSCTKDYFGCAITAAIVAANPELNVPMVTGVPV